MYKFFINNKVVFLCQNPAHVDNLMGESYIIEPYTGHQVLETFLHRVLLNDANESPVVLFYKDVDHLFREVCSFFECIEAAGGVVMNEQEEILLIFRRGFWDLPKGKIDDGETVEAAAIREVTEETGVQPLQIVHPVRFPAWKNEATYHSYFYEGKPALKVSYWYVMSTSFDDTLQPQTEEDIEQAVWVKPADIPAYYDTMYASVVDVLKAVLR